MLPPLESSFGDEVRPNRWGKRAWTWPRCSMPVDADLNLFLFCCPDGDGPPNRGLRSALLDRDRQLTLGACLALWVLGNVEVGVEVGGEVGGASEVLFPRIWRGLSKALGTACASAVKERKERTKRAESCIVEIVL